jgi:hypothetical protein
MGEGGRLRWNYAFDPLLTLPLDVPIARRPPEGGLQFHKGAYASRSRGAREAPLRWFRRSGPYTNNEDYASSGVLDGAFRS